MDLSIEPAGPGDWAAIRDLCCLTAEEGRGIERSRWPFFADLWVEPYRRFASEWAFVAREDGRVVGYITGCPASASFYWLRALLWWPWLFLKAAGGLYGDTPDVRKFLDRAKGLSQAPRLPARAWAEVLRRHPGHLHVNVDESRRGAGIGARLIGALEDALRARGVRGLHLVCGRAPLGFYERLGYTAAAASGHLSLLVKAL